MLNKYEFISLANHMLYGAVNAVRAEWISDKEFDEPAYTASIVTKFPAMMNDHWNKVRFGGCFIHKRPIVQQDGETEGCEAGDLLVLCKKTENNTPRFNATLFQIKKSYCLFSKVAPDNLTQLKLYTKWPSFKFKRPVGDGQYDILPRTVTPGAQYMFINQAPYNELWLWDDNYWHFGMPVVYTCSIPAGEMENDKLFSFGSFLWDFIHWQDGRPISESKATASDDWSRFIWDLIEMTKDCAFMHKAINSKKIARTSGEFFSFMKKKDSESHFSALYVDWLAYHNQKGMVEEVNQLDRDKIIEADNANSEEESCGIPILFIDLDGDELPQIRN